MRHSSLRHLVIAWVGGAIALTASKGRAADGTSSAESVSPQGYWVLEPVPPTNPEPARRALFVELGGAALLYSVNYEHRPLPELGLRAGTGIVPLCMFGKCETIVVIPLSIYAILGGQNHHVELGGGVTLTSIDDSDAQFAVPHVGYRYERPEGGFLFRASFTPLVRINDPKDVLPFGGLSAGYGF